MTSHRLSLFQRINGDYIRHGRALMDSGFVSFAIYRYGRWGLGLETGGSRWLVRKSYGVLKLFILNIT